MRIVRIAVVAGGWHYPFDFYAKMFEDADDHTDLFCIGHRHPDLPIVADEKKPIFLRPVTELMPMAARLLHLDRDLYRDMVTAGNLRGLGWQFEEHPNTAGDWGFLNQWLEGHNPANYDLIVWSHDDTYIRKPGLLNHLRNVCGDPRVPLWTNGYYFQAPANYCRGSFEVFTPALIESLGGRIPMAETGLDRTGKTDSPSGLDALAAWNANGEPTRQFMNRHKLSVGYLSPFYRVSEWIIEGERGLLSNAGGAPWSYENGLLKMGVL